MAVPEWAHQAERSFIQWQPYARSEAFSHDRSGRLCCWYSYRGYGNQLVSEEGCGLSEVEPGWMSDAEHVEDYPLSEIRDAETEVGRILERNRRALEALADALIVKRELGKDEIRAFDCTRPQEAVTGLIP